ncbi:hypothetical protein C8D79_2471 [Bacteriovorax stolpii]|nr:hypothetical protein C8D79_2471 [Bacteriovorax stolpii]
MNTSRICFAVSIINFIQCEIVNAHTKINHRHSELLCG